MPNNLTRLLEWCRLSSPWRWPRTLRNDQGYTLVELLVVITIIGLLASVAIPQVVRYLDRAKHEAAKVGIANISSALDLFRLDNGTYPSSGDGLKALIRQPEGKQNWSGPYLRKADVLVDPWGNEFQYRFPGKHAEFDLFSYGADSAEGGEGSNRDISNW